MNWACSLLTNILGGHWGVYDGLRRWRSFDFGQEGRRGRIDAFRSPSTGESRPIVHGGSFGRQIPSYSYVIRGVQWFLSGTDRAQASTYRKTSHKHTMDSMWISMSTQRRGNATRMLTRKQLTRFPKAVLVSLYPHDQSWN